MAFQMWQFKPSAEVAPQTSEKDRAVDMARAVLVSTMPVSCACGDVAILARQLLRALGLPERT